MTGMCCPTCHRAFESDIEWTVETGLLRNGMRSVTLTDRETKVFDVIWKAGANALRSRERLISLAWADDIDGGPESGSTVSVHLSKIRRKLQPIGLTITSRSAAHSSCWRLELLPSTENSSAEFRVPVTAGRSARQQPPASRPASISPRGV